jgi:hypothetical protein
MMAFVAAVAAVQPFQTGGSVDRIAIAGRPGRLDGAQIGNPNARGRLEAGPRRRKMQGLAFRRLSETARRASSRQARLSALYPPLVIFIGYIGMGPR